MQVTYFLNGLIVNCCFIVILLFTFVFNAKSLAIGILVFFSFFPSRPFFWTDYQKIFSNVLSVDNQKACDQDRAYSIGHNKTGLRN